jgi:hypothetical protein
MRQTSAYRFVHCPSRGTRYAAGRRSKLTAVRGTRPLHACGTRRSAYLNEKNGRPQAVPQAFALLPKRARKLRRLQSSNHPFILKGEHGARHSALGSQPMRSCHIFACTRRPQFVPDPKRIGTRLALLPESTSCLHSVHRASMHHDGSFSRIPTHPQRTQRTQLVFAVSPGLDSPLPELTDHA